MDFANRGGADSAQRLLCGDLLGPQTQRFPMLTHDELIAAKVALHERLLLDILEERFAAQPDPIDQLEAYARRRVTLRPPSQDPADERAHVGGEAVRQEFFDRLESNLRRRLRPHTPK